MIKVGDNVELLKDIVFDYGKVANKGQIFRVYRINEEGFWLKEIDVFIGHGFENEYLRKV